LIQEMKLSAGGPHVKVGFLEGGAGDKPHEESDDLTVAQVAVVNEFGLGNAPERPFMRTTAKALLPKMARLSSKLLSAVIAGKGTIDQALDVMGLTAQKDLKKAIVDWKEPPNAPATIRAKGANNPLIDTSQMVNSVQYEKV